MASAIIAAYGSAGNAAYATIYTQPAATTGIIGNITAYNTTAGALTLTLAVVESDGTVSVLAVASISGYATASFGSHSTSGICPLTLESGNLLRAQGSGAGLTVRASGLKIS